MTDTPNDAPSASDPSSLIERTALAMMRVDLGMVPPKSREAARAILKSSESEFDGARLVDLCLEGRAGDGEGVLRRAMLSLRSRLIGIETAVRRKRPGFFTRLTATLTAKLIFFGIYTLLVLIAVYLVKLNWDEADLYALGDRFLSFLKVRK